MSRDTAAHNAAPRSTGRPQASLRDHLNAKIAPHLKSGLIKSLDQEVEYPLQWLGEYLINQSILHEGNPDPTNIKSHFKYNFDAPVPPSPPPAPAEAPSTTVPSVLSASPMTNGISQDHSEYVNGETAAPAPEIETNTSNTSEGAPSEELLPGISEAVAEDMEMQGA